MCAAFLLKGILKNFIFRYQIYYAHALLFDTVTVYTLLKYEYEHIKYSG